ncbi:hypothetical protein N480_21195 [Pseudoalteromonas luteoviolacea S2607]|uniref:hypothetical protein n=1 Tax=Pseudoalteromonas luteoviolacea TaxID=43657 RepID=UPI0007B04845|nr:hypothetical protein [Pseudoalteromonas luteoviolacea]KZN34543.1 hypothetical protein N480_21195 [Pseudoalteromonas luteoviolacea S2607]
MQFEVMIVVVFLFFSIYVLYKACNEKCDEDIPLEELAMMLLADYRGILKLPVSSRVEAMERWKGRFKVYSVRLDAAGVKYSDFSIQLVK